MTSLTNDRLSYRSASGFPAFVAAGVLSALLSVTALAQCSITNVGASSGQCNVVHVSWTGTGFVTYTVFRSTSSSVSNATQVGTAVLQSFTDSTAVPFQTYHYWITGLNPFCSSTLTGGVPGWASGTPNPPANVLATAGCQAVNIAWDPIWPGVTYEVWRGSSTNTQTATSIGTATTTSYSDGPIVSLNNLPIYYWVKAVTPCGTSGFSAVTAAVPGMILQPPTGLSTVVLPGCTGVQLSWPVRSGATGYQLLRNINPGSLSASLLANVTGGNTTTFADTTAQPGTLYYYYVTSTNAACGPGLSYAGATAYFPGVPAAPTGVTASQGTNCAGIDVSWNSSSLATSYLVYRATSNSFAAATALSGLISGNATSWTDTTIPPGGGYWYFVTGLNSCGESAASAGASGFRSSTWAMTSGPAPVTTYAGAAPFALVISGAGTPPAYQWRQNLQPILGANLASLTIAPTNAAQSGTYDCIVTNGCSQLTVPGVQVVVRPRIASISPASRAVLTQNTAPFTLTVTGSGFTPSSVVYVGSTALPTTFNSTTQLTVTLSPAVPGTTETGGLPITVSDGGDVISNATALALVFPGFSAINQGVITQWPLTSNPADWLTIGIEGVPPNAPYTFVVDFTPQAPATLAFNGHPYLLGAYLPVALPVIDGLGLYGAPSGATFGSDPLGTAPGGSVRFGHVYQRPNPPLGVSLKLQAVYLDPTAPLGANLTWPRTFAGL